MCATAFLSSVENLPLPDGRTGGLVASEVLGQVVNINENSGLIAGVDPRNRDKGARCAATAVHDIDLSTANVELSASVGRRDMKSDLFNANQILAARRVFGDGEGELLLSL